ncbi:hypothetical protein BZA70DRAFT_281898 [Myxozyma melibiosi]|uniref:Uncharacterized protein n=1 Tax=Myxozyma melibiosi TaxID=54550 RepID=A0ABR1F1J2_9ASCO
MLAAQRTRVLFDALQSSRPATEEEYEDSSDDEYEDDVSKTQVQQESCCGDDEMHRESAATAACDSSDLEDDSSEYDSEYEEEPEAALATAEYITAVAVVERKTAVDDEAIARRCEEVNAQLPKYSLAFKTSIERPPVTKLVVSPKPKGILKKRYDMYYYQRESAKKLKDDYSHEPIAPEVYISVSDSASIPRPQARVHFPPRRKLEAVRLIEPRLGGGPSRSVRRKGCSSGNIGGVLERISQWWS